MTIQYRAASGALLFLVLLAGQGAAQDLDHGTFVITKSGTVIGRETFTLKQGSTVTGPNGLVISTSATYATDRAPVTITAQVDYGADSVAQQLQIDQSGAQRLVARFVPRRATIRTLSATHEAAREYPLDGAVIPVPDSLYAFYLLRPGAKTVFLNPADGRTASAHETARTADSAMVAGVRHPLTKVILGEGDSQRHLWYDEAGRLTAIEIPKLGLRAQR